MSGQTDACRVTWLRSAWRGSAAWLAIASVVACSPGTEVRPGVVMADSAGIQVVENRAARWTKAEAWRLLPDARLSIGTVDGAPEYQFARVVAAARRPDGRILVLDGGSATVREYDAQGRFIRALGRRGSGPGEFRSPVQLFVGVGDTLMVWDSALNRLTRFGPTAELVDVRPLDRRDYAGAVDPPLYAGAVSLLPDGELLVRLSEKGAVGGKGGGGKPAKANSSPGAGAMESPPAEGRFRRRSGLLRVSHDTREVDTLKFFGDVEQRMVASSSWGVLPLEPAFARRTLLAIHPAVPLTCLGEQEHPEIWCFGPARDVRRVIRWPASAMPLADAELAAWRDSAAQVLARKLPREDAMRLAMELTDATERPIHGSLVLARDGSLWVEHGPTGGARGASSDYFVFDSTGALLGTITVPLARILEIGADYVLGVQRDDMEVEYVRVHELRKPGG